MMNRIRTNRLIHKLNSEMLRIESVTNAAPQNRHVAVLAIWHRYDHQVRYKFLTRLRARSK